MKIDIPSSIENHISETEEEQNHHCNCLVELIREANQDDRYVRSTN